VFDVNPMNTGLADLPPKTTRLPKTWTHVYFCLAGEGFLNYRWLVEGGEGRAKRLIKSIRDKLLSLGATIPAQAEPYYYSNTYIPEARELVRRGYYTPFVKDEEA